MSARRISALPIRANERPLIAQIADVRLVSVPIKRSNPVIHTIQLVVCLPRLGVERDRRIVRHVNVFDFVLTLIEKRRHHLIRHRHVKPKTGERRVLIQQPLDVRGRLRFAGVCRAEPAVVVLVNHPVAEKNPVAEFCGPVTGRRLERPTQLGREHALIVFGDEHEHQVPQIGVPFPERKTLFDHVPAKCGHDVSALFEKI